MKKKFVISKPIKIVSILGTIFLVVVAVIFIFVPNLESKQSIKTDIVSGTEEIVGDTVDTADETAADETTAADEAIADDADAETSDEIAADETIAEDADVETSEETAADETIAEDATIMTDANVISDGESGHMNGADNLKIFINTQDTLESEINTWLTSKQNIKIDQINIDSYDGGTYLTLISYHSDDTSKTEAHLKLFDGEYPEIDAQAFLDSLDPTKTVRGITAISGYHFGNQLITAVPLIVIIYE